jgi:hypothetical protein
VQRGAPTSPCRSANAGDGSLALKAPVFKSAGIVELVAHADNIRADASRIAIVFVVQRGALTSPCRSANAGDGSLAFKAPVFKSAGIVELVAHADNIRADASRIVIGYRRGGLSTFIPDGAIFKGRP